MGPAATIIILALLTAILTLWAKIRRNKKYFQSRNIPFHGHEVFRVFKNTLRGIGLSEDTLEKYRLTKAQNSKIGGVVDFSQKAYLICDPTILKHVLVKDFDHFMDRQHFEVHNPDYLLQKMLLSLTGTKWKQMRNKLSPSFSTGKIRRLFHAFDSASCRLVAFLKEEVNASTNGEIDLTVSLDKFTTHVIALATCGIDSEAFDQKGPSEFQKRGKDTQLTFDGWKGIKIFFLAALPSLAYKAGLTFLGRENQLYFSNLFKTKVKAKLESGAKKSEDFVQLMLEAKEEAAVEDENDLTKKRSQPELVDLLGEDGIAANCLQFILAGYEGTQSLLLFAVYALAVNQDIQDKLRDEVKAGLENDEGQFTYQTVNGMEYLEMFINETMRFYSTCGVSARNCVKEYKIPDTDITIKEGEGLLIPIIGFHHDPEYYPNPERFWVERFAKENKSSLVPNTFLPFGLGPRDCIGKRFAALEVKVALCHLVIHFELVPSKGTKIPLQYGDGLQRKPKGGMFIALNKLI